MYRKHWICKGRHFLNIAFQTTFQRLKAISFFMGRNFRYHERKNGQTIISYEEDTIDYVLFWLS